METACSKVQAHLNICNEINRLYERKNHDYTRAVSQYPNVLWTHQADMLASHVAGV